MFMAMYDEIHVLRAEIARLTAERDEAIKDKLFAEGERDAARSDVEDLREHLVAANAAHTAAEAEASATRAAGEVLASILVDLDYRPDDEEASILEAALNTIRK